MGKPKIVQSSKRVTIDGEVHFSHPIEGATRDVGCSIAHRHEDGTIHPMEPVTPWAGFGFYAAQAFKCKTCGRDVTITVTNFETASPSSES